MNSGVSGFDSTGHGHYFASYPNSHNNNAQPSLPQSPHQQAPPRPIGQHQGGQQQHESSGHSHHTQHSYEPDTVGGQGNSNSNKGSYGNWNYINSNDRNGAQHGQQQGYGQSQDKDTQQR